MPRNSRRRFPGIPLHIVQRGNDRIPCFRSDQDLALYLGLLKELTPRFECHIHAYVLMTNHVHLLLTSQQPDGPSCLMRDLGQRYVQHFNKSHQRTGTLWEGRFRSHIVDSETYLFTCQRYIELNPVRAGIVFSPSEYPWSSYRANAGLEGSPLIVPHELYLRLGATGDERQRRYRELFRAPPGASELEEIRRCLNSGSALGCETFLTQLETLLGRSAKTRPRGRPKRESVPPDGKRALTPV